MSLVSLPRPRGPLVDVVVVGAGVTGAATAWQLARGGRQVVLIDRLAAADASQGPSRSYRQAHRSARHLRLAAKALPLWRELEAETGAALLTMTGGVDHGDPTAVSAIVAALAAHDVRHEWLDPDRAALLWPGMRFAGPVLYQRDRAGHLAADQAVAAFIAAALGHGAEIRRPLAVTRIDVRGDDLVHVHTSDGVLGARRAVVTAGGAGCLPLRRDGPPGSGVGYFPFRATPPCVARHDDWPVFVHHGPNAYGLADPCGEVGRRGRRGSRRVAELRGHLTPGLDPTRPTPVEGVSDVEVVLERRGPVVVGAGCSGRGFQHAPAVGRMLADLTGDRAPVEATV